MDTQSVNIKRYAYELKPLLPARQQQQEFQPVQKHKSSGSKSIFPQKLWHLVNNSQLDSAIRWTLDGRSFLVFENQFRNLCLGKENKFFYTTQPKSFVRQLHLYGFRKVNKNQFLHPNFKRDHPELLSNIRRTYKQSCLSSTLSLKQDSVNQDDPQQHTSHQWSTFDEPNERSNRPPIKSRAEIVKESVSVEHRYSSRTELESNQHFRSTLTELVAHDGNSTGSSNTEALPTLHSSSSSAASSVGALAFPSNTYEEEEEPFALNPLTWYGASYADINYNYNEGLTLYNSDVYPNNSCEDNNNITL